MGQVIWAPSAIQDVESIAAYLSRDSRDQAALLVSRILEAVGRLEEFPLSGRIIPEIADDSCRGVIYGAYRIMYRIEGSQVWVTAVVHGAQDWPRS
jgi:addiction module RelE/StbE family toxin